ncbi:hypothetical protein D3C83_217710 [compost metagenome]
MLLELYWYEGLAARDEPRLAGRAEYQIEYFAIAVRDRTGTRPVGVSTGCQLGGA